MSLPYAINFLSASAIDLKKLPKDVSDKISAEIEGLLFDPYSNPSVKKLKNQPKGILCLRVGRYRVVFQIRDKESLIVIVKIGHRKEIYKHLPERLKSL